MNWDDIRIFLSVARSGQILGAAKRLGLNHATVARRLTALEEALDTRLFERSTNGCDLTEAGHSFLPHAERMESEMLSAQASLGAQSADVTGTVRIGAPDGFGVAYLAPRLAELARQHPGLTLQLVPVPRSFSLSRREADLVITIERPEHGRLVAAKLTDYALGLYASPDYLAQRGTPTGLSDLPAHDLVGSVEDLAYTPALNYFADFTRTWPARFEVASALGQVEAVAAGAGIGVLHGFLAKNRSDLRRVLPEIAVHRAYWIVQHESTRALRPIALVLQFLREILARDRAMFADREA